MTDLTTWLLAQIAAEEERARAATPGPWTLDDEGCCVYSPEVGILAQVAIGGGDGTEVDAAHIAANDPAATLRRCKAYRAIVDAHTTPFDAAAEIIEGSGEEWEHLTDDATVLTRGQHRHNRATLRALASIYADADGYDPSWRLG